jgi:hypothetical protein
MSGEQSNENNDVERMKRLIVENTYAKNDNFIINNKWNDRSD